MKTRMNFTESLNSVNTYSSKGPLSCGSRGIDFVAPDAAILDLPKWYRSNQKADYEGTSLAASQVAGSIACLLSALKANNIQYSSTMIKMALSKTAYLPDGANKLEYGNGII
uniref:Peptidase S8/S53 domain-containing protein n=1 Tax=Panagrolaimus sp. PS1159 TaxID=55785 RepID=A0AC35FMD0_9BILA